MSCRHMAADIDHPGSVVDSRPLAIAFDLTSLLLGIDPTALRSPRRACRSATPLHVKRPSQLPGQPFLGEHTISQL